MSKEKNILAGLPTTSLKGKDEDYCPRKKKARIAGLDRDLRICALEKGDTRVGEFLQQPHHETAIVPVSSTSLPTAQANPSPVSKPKRPRGRPRLAKGVRSKCQIARRKGIWVPGECAPTPKLKTRCNPDTAHWVTVVRFPNSKQPKAEARCQCGVEGNRNILRDQACRARHGEKPTSRPATQDEILNAKSRAGRKKER
jgi:hypothetical protein